MSLTGKKWVDLFWFCYREEKVCDTLRSTKQTSCRGGSDRKCILLGCLPNETKNNNHKKITRLREKKLKGLEMMKYIFLHFSYRVTLIMWHVRHVLWGLYSNSKAEIIWTKHFIKRSYFMINILGKMTLCILMKIEIKRIWNHELCWKLFEAV